MNQLSLYDLFMQLSVEERTVCSVTQRRGLNLVALGDRAYNAARCSRLKSGGHLGTQALDPDPTISSSMELGFEQRRIAPRQSLGF